MKVAIRADLLGSHAGGAETYLRHSVEALAQETENTYALVTNEPMTPTALYGVEQCGQLVVPHAFIHLSPPLWMGHSTLPTIWVPTGATSIALARNHVDVFHVQMADPFVFHPRLVVTMHDIAFERFPQFFTPDFVKKIRMRVALTVRRATAIITSSFHSKSDIVRRYCIDPDRIFVAYGAASPMFKPIMDQERLSAIRTKYQTSEHFILCVGDLQPRKNLATAIRAFVSLRRENAMTHKLVIVGRKAWHFDHIFDIVRESGLMQDIIFTGYVPEDDLPGLYGAAHVFVYPSIFEGFGLPPLEAMASGISVVCSNSSSLPEVVGDAALTFNPSDESGLADALRRVLTDKQLDQRLSEKGIARAKEFSWAKTADVIGSAYDFAMAQHKQFECRKTS